MDEFDDDDFEDIPPPPPLSDETPLPILDAAQFIPQLTAVAEDDDELVSLLSDILLLPVDIGGLLALMAPIEVSDRMGYMTSLPTETRAKCRCDAQWYARAGVENIAFGCKTCALSSASCICVACFEAGDHEGHDFYISRSDYGCCDCGDIYAWKRTGFCKSHSGPDQNDDPTSRLDPWTRRVGRSFVVALGTTAVDLVMADIGNEKILEILSVLMKMAALHDGLRRIIGHVLIEPDGTPSPTPSSMADRILPVSHAMPPTTRKVWTSLLVDLMLDLEFKSSFASVFTRHYRQMVTDRLSGPPHNMSDIGDFTCQMLTRPDVAMRLVTQEGLVSTLLSTLVDILDRAMIPFDPAAVDTGPAHGASNSGYLRGILEGMMAGDLDVELLDSASEDDVPPGMITFDGDEEEVRVERSAVQILDHAHPLIAKHETVQSSMDLIYIVDHPDVVDSIFQTPNLLSEYWSKWLVVLERLQGVNPHRRRTDIHVEFPDSNWSNALTTVGDLMMSYWLLMDALPRMRSTVFDSNSVLLGMISDVAKRIHSSASAEADDIHSLHCPLNRVLGLTIFRLIDSAPPDQTVDMLASALPDTTDVTRMIRLPLLARKLHAESAFGLWRRNGESVAMETEFYKSSFFHHHMSSADMTAVRVAILRLTASDEPTRAGQGAQLGTFLGPLTASLTSENWSSILALVAEILSQQSELALDEAGRVTHRISSLLAVQDRTYSQLKDPLVERWTHTLMPRHNSQIEQSLQDISSVGSGPSYGLSDRGWLGVDLVSPYWSLRDSQKGEERLMEHLKAKGMSLSDWFRCNRTVQPVLKPQFRDPFQSVISSEWIVAIVFVTCHRLLTEKDDFRSLKLVIHIILRLCYPFGPTWVGNACSEHPHSEPIHVDEFTCGQVATAMAPLLRSCHPWAVTVSDGTESTSILTMLRELESREESTEMKSWLSLAISQICGHCVHTSVAPPTVVPDGSESSGKADKRKLMQQRLMEQLSKRQNAFLKAPSESVSPSTPPTDDQVECVICLNDSSSAGPTGRPSGYLAYISQSAVHAFEPRPFVDPTSAFTPNGPASQFMCFSPDSEGGHLITRTCGHRMHSACWTQLRAVQSTVISTRGFSFCPYCNRPANVLLSTGDHITDDDAVLARAAALRGSPYPSPAEAWHLIQGNIDQLALSLRKPSVEADTQSLEKALELLVPLFTRTFDAVGEQIQSVITRSNMLLPSLILADRTGADVRSVVEANWVWTVGIMRDRVGDKAIPLAVKPWLYRMHVMWRLFVSPSHELPFDEIVAIESALSVDDEVAMLLDLLPMRLSSIDSIPWVVGSSDPNIRTPLLSFPTDDGRERYVDAYIKREGNLRSITVEYTRFVENYPSLIPVLPSIYQKLYTSYLGAKCVHCSTTPRMPVLCLLCGSLLCCNAECCEKDALGEVTSHYSTTCSRNGVGVFLQLSTSLVHLVSCDLGRIMVAQWGSLYTDSHGEEDFGLSKPLTLNLERVGRLTAELRENSWLWRQGSKTLSWKKPVGLL